MPRKIIKCCVDRILPADLRIEAAERAIEENPANTPLLNFRPGLGITFEPLRMAVWTSKKWNNGRTLRVRFMDGDAEIQSKVEQHAQQWSQFANIKFQFGNDADAEIRISFRQEGSWSWVGTDALSVSENEPTMNFGWLTHTTSDTELSRVVLHEFGHALGCVHEHSHPEADIPWNEAAVYRYYAGPPNFWSREMVDRNVFARYSRDMTNFSAFDRDSIMLYPIPRAFTQNDFEIGMNTKLSVTDKEFIGTQYPFNPKPMVDLKIGAPATVAEIGRFGEEDFFHFVVPVVGRYTIKTYGRTDVLMGLFGPDDRTRRVAEDDNSGYGANAKIVAALQAGTYYIRVQHHQPLGTGKYRISVQVDQ